MDKTALDRMTVATGAIGAICSVAALLLAGAWVGFSTALGAAIALGNFYIYRWVVSRITGGSIMETVEDIEDVWNRVIPDYPIQGRFLDDTFNDVYNILKYMNAALAGFAFIAFSLALIGLFGLAAFMATQRTKEIGVRKVLGANSFQIARLLVWQFSKPVVWGLAIALPGAYFAASVYLNFFADRIHSTIPILLAAGLAATLLAWGTVAGHAIRIARANPVLALRYE